jgi:hypothetical protein
MIKKITLIALFASFTMHSQQAVDASGGGTRGSGGSTSYSVGLIIYTTQTSSSGSISQGAQQSYEIFTLSNADLSSVSLTATSYPNPTSDYVVLTIHDGGPVGLSYGLYDVQGKPIFRDIISSKDTQIDMHSLSAGTYLLNINENNQKLKSFKIIKK